jgi:multidrug resistance efflux pump
MNPASTNKHPSVRFKRRLRISIIAILAVATLCVTFALMNGSLNRFVSQDTIHADSPKISPIEFKPTVKVVSPKKAASVPITSEQIAVVEPYYRAELKARVSGVVKSVTKDIGERVQAGEVLVQIDVPELEEDITKCHALILQKQLEQKVSEAKLRDAEAVRDVIAATIRQREADVQAIVATRDLKKRKLVRYRELSQKGTVVGSVVEEEERDLLASEANVTAAKANVERAHADLAEAESRIASARADIELKASQVVVAQRELDRAIVVAKNAHIAAPFDGIVIRRTVDPGSFVQNASSGTSDTLISVARMDLVTLSARIPESEADLVQEGTQVEIRFSDLALPPINTTITRYAPALSSTDQTLRAEVDLFNGTESEYQRLKQALETHDYSMLKNNLKQLPARVPNNHVSKESGRLVAGMTGQMKLILSDQRDSYVLPSTVVYSKSGTNYVLEVVNDKTNEVPVRILVTDGKTVRLAKIVRNRQLSMNNEERYEEFNGNEMIVASRQLEIGDEALVATAPTDW